MMFNFTVATAAWHSVLIKAITIPDGLLTVITIERWGRRPLQILGFRGREISLVLLGFLLRFLSSSARSMSQNSWVARCLLAPARAWGPDKTTVITAAEQASTEVRASTQAISEASGRLGGIIGVAAYSFLVSWYGPAAGLIFFGILKVVGALISQVTLRETRGRKPMSFTDHIVSTVPMEEHP